MTSTFVLRKSVERGRMLKDGKGDILCDDTEHKRRLMIISKQVSVSKTQDMKFISRVFGGRKRRICEEQRKMSRSWPILKKYGLFGFHFVELFSSAQRKWAPFAGCPGES